jgi:hypothetical protein
VTYEDLDYWEGVDAYLTEHEVALIDSYESEKIVWSLASRKKWSLERAREFVDCVYERWSFQKAVDEPFRQDIG